MAQSAAPLILPARERINRASGGETSGYGVLTVRENLWLFSRLHGIPPQAALPRGHPGRQARRPWEGPHVSQTLRVRSDFPA